MILVTRYHDFSCGHRVMHGEGQCARLHGHNYRVTFKVAAPIDETGHAIEFSALKTRLCQWLEDNWDHRFLLWEHDPMVPLLVYRSIEFQSALDHPWNQAAHQLEDSICVVPFHPTTENIAQYLLNVIGPRQLEGTGARLCVVEVSETRKCGAIAYSDPDPIRYDICISGDPDSITKAVAEGAIPDPRQGELG